MTIIVSGTGIAGMSAALAVANAGHKVTLCGHLASLPPAGGIQLAPNGWQALDQLGLFDAAIKRATQLDHIIVRDLNNGATLTRLDLANRYASFGRADLLDLLQSAVAKHSAITHHPALISQAVPHKDGVDLVLDDGQSMMAAALIGADGVAGLGRRLVTGAASGEIKYPGRVAMRADIDAANLPAVFAQPASNLWLGQAAHLVHYPMASGRRINFAVTLSAQLANSHWQAKIFGTNPLFEQLTTGQFQWMKTSVSPAGSPLCWRLGRVVLAGDAAHIMPPHLAQGAGQALQDAASLQQALTATASIDDALASYARQRTSAVSAVVLKADVSGKIMALGGARGRLRNIMIGFAGPSFLQSWLADVWAGDPKIAEREAKQTA
jgi:2-polyprenyl-6-methoxyphenol hydroxylase-like FAD-dependent oxidoreductase